MRMISDVPVSRFGPAIWMPGINHHTGRFPDLGEIDITEHLGKAQGEVNGTIHYLETGDIKMNSESGDLIVLPSENGFHTYGMGWHSNTFPSCPYKGSPI